MKETEHFFKIIRTKNWNKRLYVLIDGKNFFDVPVKKLEKTYEKFINISKYNDYTTSNLLDNEYFFKTL